MDDRELAKKTVIDVFNLDLKGDVGQMARTFVPKEDKRDIANRVHELIKAVRHDERSKICEGYRDQGMVAESNRDIRDRDAVGTLLRAVGLVGR